MSKLLTIVLAGAAALALAGTAVAADKAKSPDPVQLPEQNQPRSDPNGAVVDDAQAGAAVSAKEQEYLAGLKKCESLNGQEREKCVAAARKKAGQM